MDINFIARQVNLTDDLKEFTEKKLSKFDRFFPRGADAAVTFRRIRDDEKVEVTISAAGTLFRAEESSADFKTSLIRCVDIIEGQIRRNKTRLQKRMKTSFAAVEQLTAEDIEVPEEKDFDIRTKSFPLKRSVSTTVSSKTMSLSRKRMCVKFSHTALLASLFLAR